jgi:hypothetical protein
MLILSFLVIVTLIQPEKVNEQVLLAAAAAATTHQSFLLSILPTFHAMLSRMKALRAD